ncbi:transcription factor bHLH128 [Canna indica]|uniref:Transcription factor bHLH128 n=1 Tax=Canna indica TaxID=4628 RepID=A0AAQ3K7P2_9LILI|nr:transcription factor bHLH128 [Canna indica]
MLASIGRDRSMKWSPPADGKELGLAPYGSAPGSLLAGAASAGAAPEAAASRFAPSSPLAPTGVYGLAEFRPAADLASKVGGAGPALVRHSSSPPGFFAHLAVDHGLSATAESRRLRSQWSFSRKEMLTRICEVPESGEGGSSSDEAVGQVGHPYTCRNFQLSSWDGNNSIMFSAASSFSNIDFQFGLQLQQEAVSFKVRAKRGCATHPRSIAERERRTRISKRLQKLQDLVPDIDKQTSTSEMLELAIQYIKELKNQVEKLKQEQADCTCPSKQVVA